MLEFNQRFPYKALPDAELLRNLGFDDLVATLNGPRNNCLPQRDQNAGFFRNGFNLLKYWTHLREPIVRAVHEISAPIRRLNQAEDPYAATRSRPDGHSIRFRSDRCGRGSTRIEPYAFRRAATSLPRDRHFRLDFCRF